jgi:uncharacterized SAM-binding protein YcdF (DUF218 family)
VAVLGYSTPRDTGLNPICAARLEHAAALAGGARAVVLSGWARRHAPAGEAELMRAAWPRDDVPVLLDTTARTTSGNAAGIARIARELGAGEVVVVTSSWHAPRAAALVRAALRGSGIAVTVSSARGGREPRLAARELVCALGLPYQVLRLRKRRMRAPR